MWSLTDLGLSLFSLMILLSCFLLGNFKFNNTHIHHICRYPEKPSVRLSHQASFICRVVRRAIMQVGSGGVEQARCFPFIDCFVCGSCVDKHRVLKLNLKMKIALSKIFWPQKTRMLRLLPFFFVAGNAPRFQRPPFRMQPIRYQHLAGFLTA